MKNKSGSALIIVLGVLSVLMLMSIAFSTFMRTERGATTNLRNAHIAEQTLQTALSLAVQAIEDSFSDLRDGYSNAVVDSPVAVWPQPWLASCGPEDLVRQSFDPYFFSRRRSGQDPAPQVLCSGAAEFLSSNQIAMIKSASVGWAPIYSGIGISNLYSESSARYGRNAGYPAEDSIVGRYAFVALDTTGCLDIGKVGFDRTDANAREDRKRSCGGEAHLFIPPEGSVDSPKGDEIKSPVKSRSKLANAAEKAGAFTSYKDVKLAQDAAGLFMRAPTHNDVRNDTYMPPDLYSGCTVSLEEFNPEAEPKVKIPTTSEYSSASKADFISFLQRSFPAMMSVFARSRMTGGLDNWKSTPEKITLYPFRSVAKTQIPKSALATAALLDAVDDDSVSGKSSQKNVLYWQQLKNMGTISTVVDGETVSDAVEGPDKVFESPLNFPCTESAPLLGMIYAYITIDADNPSKKGYDRARTTDMGMRYRVNTPVGQVSDIHDCGWYVEYPAKLHIGAKALCMNQGRVSKPRRNVEMKVEFDVLAETPSRNKVVADGDVSGGDVYNMLSYVEENPYKIDWMNIFDMETRSFSVKASDPIDDSSMNPDDRGSVSTGYFEDGGKTFDFTIRCGAKSVSTPGQYEDGNPTVEPTGIKYFPLTRLQDQVEDGKEPDATDVWIPLRFKVTITDPAVNDVVQQVPAPILETSTKEWWIRLDVGAWHKAGAGEHHHGDNAWRVPADMSVDGSKGDLAAGWAVCLAPQFGMDTSSLATLSANEPAWSQVPVKFWLNNVLAHAGADGNGVDASWGGGSSAFREDEIAKLDNPKAEYLGDSFDGDGYFVTPSVLREWLFKDEDRWFKWFAGCDTTKERPSADCMHVIDADDTAWLLEYSPSTQRGTRLDSELRTWFPTDGVKSVVDLGSLMIGPYETLSLFRTWRLLDYVDTRFDPESDFHPVMDYFTMSEDRYPDSKDISDETSGGKVRWNKLSEYAIPHFSAAHSGRVNLNLPRLLEIWEDNSAARHPRVEASIYLNPYPLASALNGAPFVAARATGNNRKVVTNSLPDAAALSMASAYAATLSYADRHPNNLDFKGMTVVTHITNIVHNANDDVRLRRPAVRDLSFFSAACGASSNAVLKAFMDKLEDADKRYSCDYMRESVLRGVSEAFTTRGQSFLVMLRADAYTSRFGMEDNPSDGQTLASTHALVELFRDPEPARLPDGTFPLDSNGDPVLYHNWFVRSFRLF